MRLRQFGSRTWSSGWTWRAASRLSVDRQASPECHGAPDTTVPRGPHRRAGGSTSARRNCATPPPARLRDGVVLAGAMPRHSPPTNLGWAPGSRGNESRNRANERGPRFGRRLGAARQLDLEAVCRLFMPGRIAVESSAPSVGGSLGPSMPSPARVCRRYLRDTAAEDCRSQQWRPGTALVTILRRRPASGRTEHGWLLERKRTRWGVRALIR
jgi:hypothetical protein